MSVAVVGCSTPIPPSSVAEATGLGNLRVGGRSIGGAPTSLRSATGEYRGRRPRLQSWISFFRGVRQRPHWQAPTNLLPSLGEPRKLTADD